MASEVQMSLTVSGAKLSMALAYCAFTSSSLVEAKSGVVLKKSLLGCAAGAEFRSGALKTVF